jgi:hypothetical protein
MRIAPRTGFREGKKRESFLSGRERDVNDNFRQQNNSRAGGSA